MKKYITVLVLIGICFGCETTFKPKKPDNLIAKDKMIEVLHDMFIVTAAKGIGRVKLEAKGINPEKYILEKHNIDSAQFANSNNFYAYDIDQYKTIIDTVKARIDKKKTELDKIQEKEQKDKKLKRDSIRKVKTEQRANPELDKNSSLKKN